VQPALDATYEQVDVMMKDYFAANPDVDWLWTGNSITTAAYVAKAAKKYNAKISVIHNMWGMDERMWGACGADCVGNNFVVLSFAAFGDLRYTGMEAVVALNKKWRQMDGEPEDKWANVRYVQGYVSFYMFRKALEKVIDDKKEPTGRNIKEAYESFRSLESGGLTSPISFTPQDHRPTNRTRIYGMNEFGKLRFEDEVSVQLQADWLGW